MITIGIASYNQQDYLSDAIESALNQKTQAYEIILCNDGSTDNSLEIAKKYPIKIIDQVNKGLASARNTILMNAQGEFILYLDADDILLDNCIEKLMDKIIETHADIIAPSFKEFGVRNQEVILMRDPTLEDFKTGNRIGYFSAIRRSKLLEVGGYNPKMVFGFEDWDLWHDLLKRGAKIETLKDVLVLYRTKKESMITNAEKHRIELEAQIRLNHPEIYV